MLDRQERQCNKCSYPVYFCKIYDGKGVISEIFAAMMLHGVERHFLATTDRCPQCNTALSLVATSPAHAQLHRPLQEPFQLIKSSTVTRRESSTVPRSKDTHWKLCKVDSASGDKPAPDADELGCDHLLPKAELMFPSEVAAQPAVKRIPFPFLATAQPKPPESLVAKLRLVLVKVARRIWFGKNDPKSDNRRNWGSRY